MKLQVQSYDETSGASGAYNAEAEETKFRSYSIDHQFNGPAKAIITLADVDGAMMRKYNGNTTAVYLGIGKVTIEDPTGTDIFFGRIKRATGDSASKTVTLECVDWLDQLDEEIITYDMREDLDGAGLRQSTIASDYDDTDTFGINPALNLGGMLYVYDQSGILTADAHNGQYMFLTAGMAGAHTWKIGPYTETVTASAAPMTVDAFLPAGDIGNLWTDDTDHHSLADTADWFVVYGFKVWVPDSTNWYTSISGARIKIKANGHEDFDITVQVNSGGYELIGEIARKTTVGYEHFTFEISEEFLAGLFDANGEGQVKIDLAEATGGGMLIYQIEYEVDTITTGYSGSSLIADGKAYRLRTVTDFSADATKVWEGLPYCIAKEIYKHLDTAETVGLSLLTDEGGDLSRSGPDPIVAITAAATIEHTNGFSTHQYKDKTRMTILQDLARQDKAVFWMTLGGVIVTWKKTFGADTQQLTDGDTLSWQSLYDYGQLINEYHVYGLRAGDYELYKNATDAASIAKYEATRSKIIRNTGLVSEYEASTLATTLAARDAELSQMVSCTIAGNTATAAHATTIKLGEIVEITSSYLWPNAAKDYIVTRFAYDSKDHKTYLTLHPKVSIGLQEIDSIHTQGQRLERRITALETDKYVADPVTHEVS